MTLIVVPEEAEEAAPVSTEVTLTPAEELRLKLWDLSERVEAEFDRDVLKLVCESPSLTFGDAYGLTKMCELKTDYEKYDPDSLERFTDQDKRYYFYKDNGSDILAIAHLDNVHYDPTCTVVDTHMGPMVFSGALDDRLGAYIILELLPKLGITCDILLTTDEEVGASTAALFATNKKYNWMFSFDRKETDVVMYRYETTDYRKMLTEAGAHVGNGSFSDICKLDTLGCIGMNWGCGYRDYHGPRGHAWLTDTFWMVGTFVNFYEQHSAEFLEHKPYVYKGTNTTSYGYTNSYGTWRDGKFTPSPNSGKNNTREKRKDWKDPDKQKDVPVKKTRHGRVCIWSKFLNRQVWDDDPLYEEERARKGMTFLDGTPLPTTPTVVPTKEAPTAEDVAIALQYGVCPECCDQLNELVCPTCWRTPEDYLDRDKPLERVDGEFFATDQHLDTIDGEAKALGIISN